MFIFGKKNFKLMFKQVSFYLLLNILIVMIVMVNPYVAGVSSMIVHVDEANSRFRRVEMFRLLAYLLNRKNLLNVVLIQIQIDIKNICHIGSDVFFNLYYACGIHFFNRCCMNYSFDTL